MNPVIHGDSLDVLRTFPDNSIDSIVTDPPYGIKFMGNRWDYDVPSVELWQQCLRVLKPGGYLLAFAGSRTHHRMTTRIEDAGFEIRDMIAWVYGSGFPKSVNMGDGKGTALKPAIEPITMARKPLEGTIKATHEAWGTAVLNIDACRVQTDEELRGGAGGSPLGRFPANLVHDGTVPFPVAKGQQGKARNDGTPNNNQVYSPLRNVTTNPEPRVDIDTTAARFFYCAKSTRKDRDYGCDSLPQTSASDMVKRVAGSAGIENPRAGAGRTSGAKNNHPTVKPIQLMQWLVRLVTPVGGITLDPFTGSGSTGIAAVFEGCIFIGIEKDEHHCHTANTRINYAIQDTTI